MRIAVKFTLLLIASPGVLTPLLKHFNIENVEMLWRRAPPPAPQAQAKLVSP
jgi:hypothetical protein